MATVEVARQHDVDRAAEAARAAFPAWAAMPPGERRALLNRAADLLQERSEQIAARTSSPSCAGSPPAGRRGATTRSD
jgi:acyl-CoA reductase-like NAD-dependent aldehyde dehydrogenase